MKKRDFYPEASPGNGEQRWGAGGSRDRAAPRGHGPPSVLLPDVVSVVGAGVSLTLRRQTPSSPGVPARFRPTHRDPCT